MMTDRKAKLLIVATSMLLALAACDRDTNPVVGYVDDTLDAGKWRQSEAFPESDSEAIGVEHFVTFGSGAAALDKGAMDRLDAFLQRTRQPYTKTADIMVAREIDPRSLAARRIRAVAQVLAKKGLTPRVRETPAARGDAAGDSVLVVVERIMVLTPDCTPSPPKYPLPTKNQAPQQRLGCANTNNLAHMLDDPRDLQQGRALTPGDGEMLGLGIRRYRTNQVEEIDTESTKDQAQ